MSEYYSGQGRVSVARIKNGAVGAYRWLGNVPSLSLDTKVDTKEHKESYTGQRATDKVITTGKEITVKFSLEEIQDENLLMAFQGTKETVAGQTITGETSPTLTKGDVWYLKNTSASNVVLTDSANQPLAEGVDYSIDPPYGRITLLNVGTLTMPLKADYKTASVTKIKFLDDAQGEYALRFEGLNTAEDNAPLLVEVHKMQIDPAKSFDLINNDFNKFDIEGKALMTEQGLATITKLS